MYHFFNKPSGITSIIFSASFSFLYASFNFVFSYFKYESLVFSINTKGTIFCSRECAKIMAEKGTGSIINLDSVAGHFGCGGAAYVTSKAAVIGLTKHTALRFAGKGIRCNSVCPSTIVTPMTMTTDPKTLDVDMMTQMSKHADLRVQPCMPDDVAKVCLFLASDDSRPITGQVIVCDYGSTL